jgi:hypothetical protein
MIIAALVAISLVCQIILVSIVFPSKLIGVVEHAMVEQGDHSNAHVKLRKRYVFGSTMQSQHSVLAFLSVLRNTLLLSAPMIVTGLLLSIGVAFLVQVAPLAVLFHRGVLPLKRNFCTAYPGDLKSSGGVPGLFEDLAAGTSYLIAVGLYLSYVLTVGVDLDSRGRESNTQDCLDYSNQLHMRHRSAVVLQAAVDGNRR